jgi:hypothetical protein
MTNNPNLVDVCPCALFTISLATSNEGHSHTNVCQHRGLLPLPLINGTTYYQTCFVNPYALETFILPQAIIDSSLAVVLLTNGKWKASHRGIRAFSLCIDHWVF